MSSRIGGLNMEAIDSIQLLGQLFVTPKAGSKNKLLYRFVREGREMVREGANITLVRRRWQFINDVERPKKNYEALGLPAKIYPLPLCWVRICGEVLLARCQL